MSSYSPKLLNIDAEDEEAGTILIALAQHAHRILKQQQHEKSIKNTNSMDIKNLLDDNSTSKPFYESRRDSNLKKGFQIYLKRRNSSENTPKFKRNATHIHISYRIHAHQNAKKYVKPITYPSAFRPAYHHSLLSQ